MTNSQFDNHRKVTTKNRKNKNEGNQPNETSRKPRKNKHNQDDEPNEPNPVPKVEADFELLTVLGRGGYGKVFQVKEKTTDQIFAMKVMPKKKICSSSTFTRLILTEREVLTSHSSPFLCSLHHAFQSDSRLFLVLPFFAGGDLLSLLIRKRQFSEQDARFYLAQVVLGVEILHDMAIMHRDLKLDNVLLDHRGHCKLADFGLAKRNVPKGQKTGTFCGTLQYMAPEVLNKDGYSYEIDWWAVGVSFFMLITGSLPFLAATKEETTKLITKETLKVPNFVSRDARKLLELLLKKDSSKRIGGKRVKTHRFFNGFNWKAITTMTAPFPPELATHCSTAMFHSKYTKQEAVYDNAEPIGVKDDQVFAGFNYTS